MALCDDIQLPAPGAEPNGPVSVLCSDLYFPKSKLDAASEAGAVGKVLEWLVNAFVNMEPSTRRCSLV